MKRLFNYVPMHFVVLGILGICSQFFTQFWSFGFLKILLILGFLSLLIFITKRKVLRTIIAFVFFFFVGVSAVYINDDRNYDSFYKNHTKDTSTVILKIHKVLKPGFYHHKYEAKIIKVDENTTIGKVLLNVQKDSLSTFSLKVDDQILSKPFFKEVNIPLNPHQFNYKSYLEKQGVHQQVFLKGNQFLKIKSNENTLYGLSAKFRNHILKSLQKYNFKKDELAVINALLLGQRQNISKELITDYQRAGAIHILAVSGLHIGMILLMLSFLLKPLERIKYGKFFKTTLLILLLWMFAFIAGLSASVVRAVTMFTFVAIGMSFRRKNIVEFSLISSLFFLLLMKPMFLFDVGFQLSYLAVLGIIWVQPKLSSIWKPKYKAISFFWQLFTVSIAAQLGILPLSIYYFQQFPGLFLASNLIIIPLLGTILIGGVLVIITAVLNVLPQVFANVYGFVISKMNAFVSWVSHQEEFLFKELSISFWMLLSWYILIFLGVRFFIFKSPKKLLFFLISILLIQSLFFLEKKEHASKNELIVFHKSRISIIGKRVGEKLFLQYDLDSLKANDDYSFRSYRIANDIKNVHQINFKNYIEYGKKNILIIDSLGVYNLKGLKKPIIILQYSPKINLTRLIKTIKPSQIVVDGSNYKSYVIHWKKTCLENQIPFYYTGEKGAFILKE